jgi:thioredoxin reductase
MTYDAIVVGGSFAGLSGAMMLARARRSVLVLDAGLRRNRFAAHAHGVLALDGVSGAEIAATASAQLALYPTVTQIRCTVASIEGADGAFTVRDDTGRAFSGRKVLLATGVSDGLPTSPDGGALGRSVFHCPYCHGYEIGGGAIGVLATGSASVKQAMTVADWGEVTYFAQGDTSVDASQREMLRRRGVAIDARQVASLEGNLDGPVHLRLVDGDTVTVKAVFVMPRNRRARSPPRSAARWRTHRTVS